MQVMLTAAGGLADALDAAVEELADPLSGPMADAWQDVGAIAAEDQGRQFDELSSGGGGWEDLSPETKKEKARKGYPTDRILVGTGGLRATLNRGTPGHYSERLPDGIREGTSHPAAAVHQYGDPARGMPARPVINPPTPDAEARMRAAISAGITATVLRALRQFQA